MNTRTRVLALVGVVAIVGAATAACAAADSQRTQRQSNTRPEASPTASPTDQAAVVAGPRIVFRHTGLDDNYGLVAMVALEDPGGPRVFTDVPCDRVAATAELASCLVTLRGVDTTFKARTYSPDWEIQDEHPLDGIPSRTRLADDSLLVATTSFETGHEYMTQGFATETVVREVGGTSYGNLERFRLIIDGAVRRPEDRNVWGVTFVDDTGFYATVGTGGRTYLVEGDLAKRTLTAVTENAECPSISPDKTRVAFKVDTDPGPETVWGLAVLDLASGRRTELRHAPAGVDDQVEWLDDDTLLYGLPRTDEPGVDDVWALEVAADAQPWLLIEQAWSPSVVRTPVA